MSHIRYLNGIKKELHHIKQGGDDGGYEPTLVILHSNKPGRSFMIPINAMWKYVDPHKYKGEEGTKDADSEDFNRIVVKAREVLTGRGRIVCWQPSKADKHKAIQDLAVCQLAWSFSRGTSILLCTSFNLFKCMQMFDIEPKPQAAAQLLLWIQDALDELKNMPECPEKDAQLVAGEATVFVDGAKVATRDMILSETEVIEQESSVGQ